MPALESQLLEDFATPLAGKPPAEGPQMVAFVDEDGASYPVTIDGSRLDSAWSCGEAKSGVAKPAPPADSAFRHARCTLPPPLPPRHGSRLVRVFRGDPRAPRAAARVAGRDRARTRCVRRVPVDGQSGALSGSTAASRFSTPRSTTTSSRRASRGSAATDTGVNADLSLDLHGVRVRVNAFDHTNGHAVAARIVREAAARRSGLASRARRHRRASRWPGPSCAGRPDREIDRCSRR